MGDYTRVKFNVLVRSDTPAEVLALLTAMSVGQAQHFTPLPAHQLFQKERWYRIGCSGGATFDVAPPPSTFIAVEGGYALEFDCAFKNYDGELDAFFNWIAPYLANKVGAIVGLVQNDEERISHAPGALLVVQRGSICQLHEPQCC